MLGPAFRPWRFALILLTAGAEERKKSARRAKEGGMTLLGFLPQLGSTQGSGLQSCIPEGGKAGLLKRKQGRASETEEREIDDPIETRNP